MLITLMLAVMLSICGLFACDVEDDIEEVLSERTKLTAPLNIRVEDNVVKWSSVENASSYIIQVGDDTATVVMVATAPRQDKPVLKELKALALAQRKTKNGTSLQLGIKTTTTIKAHMPTMVQMELQEPF